MPTLNALVAGSHTLEIDGKTITFKLVDRDMEAEFQKRMFAAATSKVDVMKSVLPEPEYYRLLREVSEAYAAGAYKMVSKTYGMSALVKPDGLLLATQLMTGLSEEECTSLLSSKEHAPKVAELISVVLTESFGKKVEVKEKNG